MGNFGKLENTFLLERYFHKILQKNPDRLFDLLNICFLNNKDCFLWPFLEAS